MIDLRGIFKLICDVFIGFFYLFVDLNLPQRRKFDTEDKDSSSDINRKLFECPGCLDIPQPPVFTCSSGHIVCTQCKEDLESCPICDGDYKGNARNFIVERIVTTTNFPCRFQVDGCEKVMSVPLLPEHQQTCFYRHCKCGITGKDCDGNWLGSVNGLYAHLVISHEMFFIFRDKKANFKAEIDPSSNNFLRFHGPTVMLKVLQGKNYVITTVFNEELNIIFTYIIGLYRDRNHHKSPEKYKMATASIKLCQRDVLESDAKITTTPEIDWIGPVNSVDDEPGSLFEEGSGLLLPWNDLFKASSVTDKFVTWDLKIDIFPQTGASCEEQTTTDPTSSPKNSVPLLLKPFFKSTWVIVAPSFTVGVILYFICFV